MIWKGQQQLFQEQRVIQDNPHRACWKQFSLKALPNLPSVQNSWGFWGCWGCRGCRGPLHCSSDRNVNTVRLNLKVVIQTSLMNIGQTKWCHCQNTLYHHSHLNACVNVSFVLNGVRDPDVTWTRCPCACSSRKEIYIWFGFILTLIGALHKYYLLDITGCFFKK